jgi:RHS repeat-associated protein
VWLEERPSSLPEEFFFTGKEFDPETGFYNFGVRYLDPRFSKWMTADPALGGYLSGKFRQGVFAPTHLALYTYGLNNPATYFDPDGEIDWQALGWGIAKGVAIGALGVAVVGAIVLTGGAAAALGAPLVGAAITTYGVGTVAVVGAVGTAYTAAEIATQHDYIAGKDLNEAEVTDRVGQLIGGAAVGLASRGAVSGYRAIARWAGREPAVIDTQRSP